MPNTKQQSGVKRRLYMCVRKRRFNIVSYIGLFLVFLLAAVNVYQMIYIARLETVAQRLTMRESSLFETNKELIKLFYGYEKPTYLDNRIDIVRIHHIGKAYNESDRNKDVH